MEPHLFHSKHVVMSSQEKPVEAVLSVDPLSGIVTAITVIEQGESIQTHFPDSSSQERLVSFGDLVIFPGVVYG